MLPGYLIDIGDKVKKEDTIIIDCLVYGYTSNPSDDQIKSFERGSQVDPISQNNEEIGNYITYYNTFQLPQGYKYFEVHEINTEGIYQAYSYLYVGIDLTRHGYA